VISCENFEYVNKTRNRANISTEKMFLLNHFEPPTKQQERWKEELNTEIVNWNLIYKIPFYCTKKTINLLFFNAKYCI
jgi:hypothetical protein